jgi:DNA-directed RNA polymerase subunit RPC12/RpoP
MISPKNAIFSFIDAGRPRGHYLCRAIHKPTGLSVYENGTDKEALQDVCLKKLGGVIATCNIGKDCICVNHSDLQRYSLTSIHKSVCPACKDGILMMQRDPQTMRLLPRDRCILCGQEYEYTDLEKGEIL